MGKRRIFLLFLSAMSVSIIVMMIIYGVFIKDFDFSFNVKNPEMAPSPIDMFENPGEQSASGDNGPSKINTPDLQAKNEEGENPGAEEELETLDEEITEVVPLESQVGNQDDETNPLPDSEDSGKNASGHSGNNVDNTVPSLHFVYLDGFSTREAAEQAVQQLQDRNLVAHPYIRQHKGQIILQFGVFSDEENAEVMAKQLRNQNVFVKVD